MVFSGLRPPIVESQSHSNPGYTNPAHGTPKEGLRMVVSYFRRAIPGSLRDVGEASDQSEVENVQFILVKAHVFLQIVLLKTWMTMQRRRLTKMKNEIQIKYGEIQYTSTTKRKK